MLQNTKESRLKSRDYQFNKLIEAGYIRETYKEIDFFTINNGKYFTLKVYRGTGANHVEYVNYRTEERRAKVIQNYKSNYDSRQDYKAEQKIKNKGKLSSHAAAAAAIKAELSTLYPHIKFSVKSESFSMGDSVRVNWTDGPTSDEVDNIISKYQYGHFNGMEDMYESTNRRADIPQSKYVSGSRSISAELEAILLPDAEKLFCSDHYNNVRDVNDFIRRIFYHCSIPSGATVTGIVSTGVTCGISSPETFYKIGYTLPETAQKTTEPNFNPVAVVAGEVNIIDYSEKAFAVVGDTKPIKDKLKALGGSFNPRLSCGAGWIFSKKKLNEVTKALSEGEKEPEPVNIEPLALPTHYDTLQGIEEAAKGGKVISLYNLSQLINNV